MLSLFWHSDEADAATLGAALERRSAQSGAKGSNLALRAALLRALLRPCLCH